MSDEVKKVAPADFVWYELHTNDGPGAEAFYGSVIGWEMRDSGMPGRSYVLLSAGGVDVAGLLTKPASAFAGGAKPGWMGYIGVSDVDAYALRVLKAGGVVHRAAEDIPGVGRFAVVADPQGAIFVLFQGLPGVQAPQHALGALGTGAWHDLTASNWESAFGFYAAMFGWSKAMTLDMGPAGSYQVFGAGTKSLGGMMTRMDKTQAPFWLYYFNVENVEATAAKVKSQGGNVVHGPVAVPSGETIAHCVDPQGAIFGIVSPKR